MNSISIQTFVSLFLYCFICYPLLSNELNLQIGMETWDKAFFLQDGLHEGTLTKRKSILILKQAFIKIWKQKEHLLIVGLNEQGEEKWKLLKNSKTNLAYFTKLPSFKLELVSPYSEIEKIPEFDFSLADLLFYKIEEKFLPRNVKEYKTKTNIYYKIQLEPLRDSQYQQIFIYLSKETLSPHRMDIFLPNGDFSKIIYLELDEKNKHLRKILATDTNTSEISILEFKSYRAVEIPENLFELSHFSHPRLRVSP